MMGSEQIKDAAIKYDKPTLARMVQMGQLDARTALMAGMMRDRIVQAEMKPPSPPTVAEEVMQPMGQRMGMGAPQPQQVAAAGISQIPVPENMFEEPQEMAGGGIVAFQAGGSRKLDPKVAALMQANPGMTASQAIKLLSRVGPTATFGAGLAATDALMATDTGVGSDAAMGSGYDYATEEMAGGRPDIPVGTTGTREDTRGFMDYMRAAGLAPKEQVMDPVTGKFVDVPSKELFRSASPGLAGAPVEVAPPVEEVKAPAAAAAPRAKPKETPPSEVALITEEGGKLLPRQGLSVTDFRAQQKEFGIKDDVDADLKKQIDELAAGSKGDREQAKYMAMLQAGLGIMGGTSPYALQNIGAGAQKGLAQYAGDIKDIKKEERDLVKLRGELARAEDARKRGDFKTFQDASDKAKDFELKTAEQATRNRLAGIQEKYYAGKLSADNARIAMLQERNRLTGVTNLRNARKQFMDEGGESKLRSEFIKRFGKNWEKDSGLMRSFKQQMDAEINKIAGMSDSGVTSAEDLLEN